MSENKLTDANVSEIDKALNAAKARSAAKKGTAASTEKPARAPKPAKEPSAPKRPRLTDEEKAARASAKSTEQAAKKAARLEARAAKQAARAANRAPAHLKKVDKAAERLPRLTDQAQLEFNSITASFGRDQVAALAAHLSHFNRVQATTRALDQRLTAGMQVRIVSGDPRFVGQVGTVVKSQRIRCYIEVTGAKKPLYCFTSDVTPISSVNAATA
jgi:hypothetical protein